MKRDTARYRRYWFPAEIISYAIWVYYRLCMSFRDVEELLAQRGIIVSYETIRAWCRKFGPHYVRNLKRRQGCLGNSWQLDEDFIWIHRQQYYLWRAVDQDGEVIDTLVQPRRDQRAAERFFRWLLRTQGRKPFRIITDKLRICSAPIRAILGEVANDTQRYANNRVEARIGLPGNANVI